MSRWIRTCLLNWRWWVALPVAIAMAPAGLVSLLVPITTPAWYRRMNKWVFATAPQADQQGEECPHDWYPYVQALYKTYGPVTMDDKGIAGYETLGRMCAECGKIEAPAKPFDQQGADEVEQAAATGYTDPEPVDTLGYLTTDGSLTYTGQRKVVEHATTELGTALALLQSVQQRLEAIDCQPLQAALSSPPGVQAAQVSEPSAYFVLRFFRDLSDDQRRFLLVGLGALPDAPNEPFTHSIQRLALHALFRRIGSAAHGGEDAPKVRG